MKVWELMNKIKGTEADQDEILNWMVMNKICPLEVETELDEGAQPAIDLMAHKHCEDKPIGFCGSNCYKEFLITEARGTAGEQHLVKSM